VLRRACHTIFPSGKLATLLTRPIVDRVPMIICRTSCQGLNQFRCHVKIVVVVIAPFAAGKAGRGKPRVASMHFEEDVAPDVMTEELIAKVHGDAPQRDKHAPYQEAPEGRFPSPTQSDVAGSPKAPAPPSI